MLFCSFNALGVTAGREWKFRGEKRQSPLRFIRAIVIDLRNDLSCGICAAKNALVDCFPNSASFWRAFSKPALHVLQIKSPFGWTSKISYSRSTEISRGLNIPAGEVGWREYSSR